MESQVIVVRRHERGAAPVVGRARNEFEPAGVGHKGAVHADDAQKNLVAGRGLVADLQLPALVAGRDRQLEICGGSKPKSASAVRCSCSSPALMRVAGASFCSAASSASMAADCAG